MISDNRILWLPGEERSWDDDGGSRSPAGVRINADNATAVAAVFACVRILSETVASLPLHVLERLSSGGKRQARELPLYKKLHTQPNSWQTSFEWREQMVRHVALWGDSESEIRPGESGYADQIIPLHPSRMKVEVIENDRLRYTYREAKGRQTVYSQDQILHVRGPSDDGVHGQSIAEECREAIALARACEIHGARFFGGGARPGFILSTDNNLNAEARRELADGWNRKHRGPHNAFETAVLTGGLKPYEIPYASNSDSQFLELRKYQLSEIARLFRIPMHLLQEGGGSYGSIEHAGLDFVQHTILPWLRRLESAFTRDLLPDDEARDRYQISFDVRGLLRGDAASRSSYYRAMWDIGVLSTNDILALEDMNPVEGGDARHRPLNMGRLGEDPSATDVLAQQQPGSGIDGQAVEGGVDAATQPATDTSPQVAEVSLNGAQITGLIAIIQQVSTGLITKVGASAMIAAAFPTITQPQIDAILAGVPDQPVQPQQPTVPAQASRDCGTGAGGFKPGNKCAPGGSGGDSDSPSGGAGGAVDASTFSSQPNFAPASDYPAAGNGGLVGARLHEVASESDLKSYESMSVSSGTNYVKNLLSPEAASDLRKIVKDDSFKLAEAKTVYFGVDSDFDSKIGAADEYQFTAARHSGITPERALNYAVKTDRTGSGAVYEMELPAGSRTVFATVFDQPEVVSLPLSRIKVVERGEREIDGVQVPYRRVRLVDDGSESLSGYFSTVDRIDSEISKKSKRSRRKKGSDGGEV